MWATNYIIIGYLNLALKFVLWNSSIGGIVEKGQKGKNLK